MLASKLTLTKIQWLLEPYSHVLVKSLVVSSSLWLCGLQPTTLLHARDFTGKSAGVGCHFLLQRIFPTQGSNSGLPHCRQMLYCLSHQSVFIFASFPFNASKNQLTISFPLYFCGTVLPWLSSYMFGPFSLVSVFRLIFSPSPWMCPTPDSIFCSFFSFFFFLFLFHVLSLLIVSNTAMAVQNQIYSYKNKVNCVTIPYSELNGSKAEYIVFLSRALLSRAPPLVFVSRYFDELCSHHRLS